MDLDYLKISTKLGNKTKRSVRKDGCFFNGDKQVLPKRKLELPNGLFKMISFTPKNLPCEK